MMKVAVTGNIGSGKTEFIKFISKLGFSCISSDAIISKLYKDDRTRKIILEKLKLNDHNYKQEIIKKQILSWKYRGLEIDIQLLENQIQQFVFLICQNNMMLLLLLH